MPETNKPAQVGGSVLSNKLVQLGVFALMIGAFVVLTLKNVDMSLFVSLFSPILSAVFVVNHLSGQDQVLNKISEQTNGVLSKKIEEAVAAALAKRQDPTL